MNVIKHPTTIKVDHTLFYMANVGMSAPTLFHSAL